MNAPAVINFIADRYHAFRISRPSYKAEYGSWSVLELPGDFRLNTIHAMLLRTGKVLLIAGSGNQRGNFEQSKFKTVVWDPVKNTYQNVPTPADLFCMGQSALPNGNFLVAGGTARYEVLASKVTRAAGAMRIINESPNGGPRTFPKGTRLITDPQPNESGITPGLVFRTTSDVTIQPATKLGAQVRPSDNTVFVEAEKEGKESVVIGVSHYRIEGLEGADAQNLYGMGESMTLNKQDYQGIKKTFEFNPDTEQYELVEDMAQARWYPTLVTLPDDRVLSVSGLDGIGRILQGDNEIYDPKTKTWSAGPKRYFPTYPALFLTAAGTLFYTGSNAGYGPSDTGRVPGIWDYKSNTFTPVPGLRDPTIIETSASVMLPPAQDQRVMIIGGGGVGESRESTRRTDIIDLNSPNPHFTPGPDLPKPARYINAVILPNDTVLTANGSTDYRGKGQSELVNAQLYAPKTNRFTAAAESTVARSYHAAGILLPDGRVVTTGGDPLFSDKQNARPGRFEQRVEIYSPPYLFQQGRRPQLTDGPQELTRGATARFQTPDTADIAYARLIRPGASTHVTDVEQRSIALDLAKQDGAVTVAVPANRSLVLSGWYLLFVVNKAGVPSVGRWVHVS